MTRAILRGRQVVRAARYRQSWGGSRRVQRTLGWDYYYEVRDREGKVVASDNTGAGGWQGLMDDASERVAAVRTVEQVGHTLRPYSDLVDEASEDL